MSEEIKKRVLIVDDSEIDREVLKMILEEICEIDEATDAFAALEAILDPASAVDAIMLDVMMPGLDGFGFLRVLKMMNITKPVLLITSEATRENVSKAAKMSVNSFISKPFHRELVQARVSSILNGVEASGQSMAAAGGAASAGGGASSEDELVEFIKRLEDITKNYLKARKKNDKKYKRIADVTGIILEFLSRKGKIDTLTDEDIAYISKAAYFCDIGLMFLPDEMVYAPDPLKFGGWQEKMLYKNHTTMGADMVSLGAAPSCKAFAEICADLCQNHHERVDGKGYPRGIHEEEFSINAQACGMAYELVTLAEQHLEKGGTVEDAINEFERTTGNYGALVFEALAANHNKIVAAFR